MKSSVGFTSKKWVRTGFEDGCTRTCLQLITWSHATLLVSWGEVSYLTWPIYVTVVIYLRFGFFGGYLGPIHFGCMSLLFRCISTERLSSSVAIRSKKWAKEKETLPLFMLCSFRFCNFILKVSIMLLIFVFQILFLCLVVCCCIYDVTKLDPIWIFGFLWLQIKICVVLHICFYCIQHVRWNPS